MLKKIRKQMEEFHMAGKSDCIAAAVSGGADSVCLLLLLKELQKSMGFSLEAIHIEHGIRGEESRKDAFFVEGLCKKLKIPCKVVSVDVPSFAKTQKVGMEEAARILRYQAFQKYALQKQAKIALAHHMDDNAETVLFQMLRGSSLTGLSGILPIRQDEGGVTYIRPLLVADRREIEAYLERAGQEFCLDSTNLENDYSRNYLRNVAMPHLKQVNRQAVSHISRMAASIAEVRDFMEAEAKRQMAHLVKQESDAWSLDIKGMEALHPALKKQVAYGFIGKAAGSKKDIAATHVEQLLHLMQMQSGRRQHLPYGLTAKKEYNKVYLYKEKPADLGVGDKQIAISSDDLKQCLENGQKIHIPLGEANARLSLEVFANSGKIEEIPKKTYTKWLDYDKIKQGFCIRTRQSGDYFISDGAGHKKKLKQYFIDEKIPANMRSTMWLLAQESLVIWLVGGRISEHAKVTKDTKIILKIDYNGGM
uniref:tRNA lysidine(34) synthetase TilS n=1 Tax=Agathobacter sp. TaxID=2021311 RepID=UPI004055A1B6